MKILSKALAAFLLASACMGQTPGGREIVETGGAQVQHRLTITTNIAAGVSSWTWTNNLANPWQIGDVEFTLGLVSTQTLAINVLMTDQVLLYAAPTVETNGFGRVQTNYLNAVTSVVNSVYTNYLVADTVTNRGNVIYNIDGKFWDGTYMGTDKRVPRDSYILPYNVVGITWTQTDAPVRIRLNGKP